MTSPVRALVLDIGGVLELTPPTGWRHRWEQRLGLEPDSLMTVLAEPMEDGELGRRTLPEVEATVAELLDLDTEASRAFWADAWDEYLGSRNDELFDFVAGLRPQVRVGLLSNSFVGARELEHERYRLADLCDDLVYSHEVGMRKPDPAIYRLACDRLGVAPHEAIMVDDREVSVAAARDVGMRAVHFVSTATAIDEIGALLPAT